MEINPIRLKHLDRLMTDYRNNDPKIMEYFDYSPFHDFSKRVEDIKTREYNREELTTVLKTLNNEWNAPQSTMTNIERLKDNQSAVVIGGQQAGLMTGPLYTANKVISIIKLAKQQEKELGVPIIPVFWIAGEDHDYDEINHIYILEAAGMVQHKTKHHITEKQSISNIDIDENKTKEWLNTLFTQLHETEYTKDLYTIVEKAIANSKTYVDFFAQLIFEMFSNDGLVLIDSGNSQVRNIESDYFIKIIEQQANITASVYKSYQRLSQDGYSVMLDVDEQDAHLFYEKDNERVLLIKNEEGAWVGKQNEVKFSNSEMIAIAKETPHVLSNNVVSRPLMQELLFPTLAFVGGNGEIGYWAVLKSSFEALGLKMPPVVPRLSFTFVDQSILKILNKFDLSEQDVLSNQIGERKGNWLAAQHNPPVELMIKQLKQTIDRAHLPLRTIAKDIRADLGEVANKNLYYLNQDIEHLEKSIMRALEEKFAKELSDFDRVNDTLNPLGGLQERVWNPLPILNQYGPNFFQKITDMSLNFEKEHYLIHI